MSAPLFDVKSAATPDGGGGVADVAVDADGSRAYERARAMRELRRADAILRDANAATVAAAAATATSAAGRGRGMFAYRPPAAAPPPPPVDYSTLLELAQQDDRPGATKLLQNLLSMLNQVSAISGKCSDGKHWSYHARVTIEKRLLEPDGSNLETVLPAFAPGMISASILWDLHEAKGLNRDAFGSLTLKDLVMSAGSNLQHNAINKGMAERYRIEASCAAPDSGGIRVGAYGANQRILDSAMAYKQLQRATLKNSCGKCDYGVGQ